MGTHRKYGNPLGLKDPYIEGEYIPWWSIEASKRCLLQFSLIRSKAHAPDKSSISDVLLHGTGVHAGAEQLTKGKSMLACEKVLVKEIKSLAKTDVDPDNLARIIEESRQYFRVTAEIVKPLRVGKGYAEHPFRVNYKGYIFAGRIDHIEVIDPVKKICDVWDYKCVQSANSLKGAQLQFYCACLTLLGWTIRKVYFIAPPLKLIKPVRCSQKVQDKRLSGIITWMDGVLKKNEYPPQANLWTCRFCKWGFGCPYSVLSVDLSDLKEGANEI